LVLSTVLIGTALVSAGLPLPPAWAWQLALMAFALHCLVDFNLQSPAIWGTLIVVSVLAGGWVRFLKVSRINRSVALLLVVACLVGFLVGARRVAQVSAAMNLLASAAEPQSARADPAHKQRPVPDHSVLPAAFQWPTDAELVVAALRHMAPGQERIPYCSQARHLQPWDPRLDDLYAQDLAVLGDERACDALRTAVALNPAYLPRRLRLVELYERAATWSPERRDQFLQLAQAERERIAELAPIVHPRNRLRPLASGLPVQPAP
jgi:hypothetical protein